MNIGRKIAAPGTLAKAPEVRHPSEQRGQARRVGEFYSAIRRASERSVAQKTILSELQFFGIKLHQSRSNELLDAEGQLGDASGNRAHFNTWGSILPNVKSHRLNKCPSTKGGES